MAFCDLRLTRDRVRVAKSGTRGLRATPAGRYAPTAVLLRKGTVTLSPFKESVWKQRLSPLRRVSIYLMHFANRVCSRAALARVQVRQTAAVTHN
jgi:hypothetical protein